MMAAFTSLNHEVMGYPHFFK
ncbi:hypothetical protein BN1200_260021 [Klebsiella variicola]|nr:hypothetical protein KVR801_90215 [Klebsiella variicola]CTQ05633.1 hypothetical protein BN1200_260021 [Klebsiella variicola]CTQ24397.1 hypothetical protein BN1200_490021 [Klebsiella variicola]SBN32495.1 conserved hypothetical protein [Klebsiella variicola]